MTPPLDHESGPATVRVGFKNILGSGGFHWGRRWSRRVVQLERELLGPEGMRAAVYAFVEVKGWRKRRSLGRMLPGWEVARATGRIATYNDPTQNLIVEAQEFALGSTTTQGRTALIVTYENLATGIPWTVAITHLSSSGGTTAEHAAASRSIEATELARLCHRHQVDVIAADLNNSADRPDTPRGILTAAGYRDWRSTIEVDNVGYDSHYEIGKPNPRQGKHLDAIYLGPRVTPLEGRLQITEPENSDHLGLVCTVSILR